MEVVRTTVACECVYVRAMVIKALIWMQSPHESFDELKSIIASELSDPAWPATLLNDILLTLHARFKVQNGRLSNNWFEKRNAIDFISVYVVLWYLFRDRSSYDMLHLMFYSHCFTRQHQIWLSLFLNLQGYLLLKFLGRSMLMFYNFFGK